MRDQTSHRLKPLAERQSMIDDALFVGRAQDLSNLRDAQVAWIHGPGRVGKSSLARRLIDSCRRPLWLDVGDVSSGRLDDVLRRACERVGATDGEPRASYERAVRGGHVDAVVFDEFDHIAVNLDGDAQAFLRRLAEECRGTRTLFVTRRPPMSLVEEVDDARSRLLNVAIPCAPQPLERGDVIELLRRAGGYVGGQGLDAFAPVVWRETGGHPVSAMTIAHGLAVLALSGVLPAGRRALPDDIERRHGAILDQQARSLWLDLPPLVRAFLLEEEVSQEAQIAARDAGYVIRDAPHRPARLLKVGRVLGANAKRSTRETGALPDAIDERVYAINRATARRCGHPFFRPTNEANGGYLLARQCTDEATFRAVIDHLYKRFYESAKAHVGDAPPTKPLAPGLWELAAPWRKDPAMVHVCSLRQDFFHDQTPRGEERSDGAALAVGEVYRSLCGRLVPSADDWTRCRKVLLQRLIEGLDDLLTYIEAAPQP